MRALFDTNVVLGVLLARAPHVAPATALLDRVAAKQLDGLLGTTTLTTTTSPPGQSGRYLPTDTYGRSSACSTWRR